MSFLFFAKKNALVSTTSTIVGGIFMKRPIFLVLLFALAVPSLLTAVSIPQLKAVAEAAVKAAVAAPTEYAPNWMAAKACREYGDEMVSQESPGWKEIAKVTAREGMKFGDIAQKLKPNGIEGWYWYGLNVGTYSDCVSILTALGEGLKGKTQKAFETSYNLDKMYDDGGPILSLGRFWQVLPGIAGKDLRKAEKLFNEYIALMGTSKDANEDAWYYRGSLYKELGRVGEARTDLQKAVSLGQKDAGKLLAEMK
jgi:tetratricopeptide (TPR) repeat protein